MCRQCNDTDVGSTPSPETGIVYNIDARIKTHRRNLQMISSIDKQIVELQSAIHEFYVESGVVQTTIVSMHNDMSKLLDDLEAIRLRNYEITKDIV